MLPIITQRDASVNTQRVRQISRCVKNGGMSFAANLKRLRDAAGLTQEGLALRLGYKNQSRIGNYESTKNPRLPSLLELPAIAEVIGCSVAALFSEDDGDPDWANIRALAQAIGLGNGKEAAEYAEMRKLKFRADSLRRKGLRADDLQIVYGAGDSMLPRIRSGDAIMYDTSDVNPKHKALFVIQRGDEYSAKQCKVLDDRVYFEALNPDGDHVWKDAQRMDSKRHPIVILGRVRWIGSWED